jgi:hypothetical protein
MPTTSNNCTISIKHDPKIECVRTITYCLNQNDTDVQCNTTDDIDDFKLEYLSNFTSNLSIIYDIIYTRYQFTINILQCTDEGRKYYPSTKGGLK